MIETIGHLNNAGMKPLFVLLYMPCLLKRVSGNKRFWRQGNYYLQHDSHKSNIDISDLLIL
jgi:hypothetical protein